MLAWYILIGVLALLLILLLIPITVRISFDEQLKMRAYYGWLPIARYPRKHPKKPKPRKKAMPKRIQKQASKFRMSDLAATLKQQGPMGFAEYLREVARLSGTAFKRILAAITVDRAEMQIVVATGDAAETALLYGKLCGIVYPAQAVVERYVRIKRRQMEMAPNFILEQGYIKATLTFHVIPLRLLVAMLMIAAAWIRKNNNPTIKETAKDG